MDKLVDIYNTKLINVHVLVKAAFLHHAFAQIHPFQDENGRIARLLASLALIREGLFPFSLDREERSNYIDALEHADRGLYQPLVDIIASNQIASIMRSLNWPTVTDAVGYEKAIDLFKKKIIDYKTSEDEQHNLKTNENMQDVFNVIKERIEYYKDDLMKKLDKQTIIKTSYLNSSDQQVNIYNEHMFAYAKQHNYYANLSLDKHYACINPEFPTFFSPRGVKSNLIIYDIDIKGFY